MECGKCNRAGKYIINERNLKAVLEELYKLKEDLSCAICLEICTDPIKISCGHCCCSECIEQLYKTKPDRLRIPCPKCKKIMNEEQNTPIDNLDSIFVKSVIQKLETKYHTSLDNIHSHISNLGVTEFERLINEEMNSKKIKRNTSKFNELVMKASNLKSNKNAFRKTKSLNCIINKVEKKEKLKRHSVNNLSELLTQQVLFKEKCNMVATMLESDCIARLDNEYKEDIQQNNNATTSKFIPPPTKSIERKKATPKSDWSRIRKINKKFGNKRIPEQLNITNTHIQVLNEQPTKIQKTCNMDVMEKFFTENMPSCSFANESDKKSRTINESEQTVSPEKIEKPSVKMSVLPKQSLRRSLRKSKQINNIESNSNDSTNKCISPGSNNNDQSCQSIGEGECSKSEINSSVETSFGMNALKECAVIMDSIQVTTEEESKDLNESEQTVTTEKINKIENPVMKTPVLPQQSLRTSLRKSKHISNTESKLNDSTKEHVSSGSSNNEQSCQSIGRDDFGTNALKESAMEINSKQGATEKTSVENAIDTQQSIEEFLNETIRKCVHYAKDSNDNQHLHNLVSFIKKNTISILNSTDSDELKTNIAVKDVGVGTTNSNKEYTVSVGVQTDPVLVSNRVVQTIKVEMKDASVEVNIGNDQLEKRVDVVLKRILSPKSQALNFNKIIDSHLNRFGSNTKRKLNYISEKENMPQNFKRIRLASDSDSESELGFNERDLSVQFCSNYENQQDSKPSAHHEHSINSDDMNYDEYLNEVLQKCDEEIEYNEANVSRNHLEKSTPKCLQNSKNNLEKHTNIQSKNSTPKLSKNNSTPQVSNEIFSNSLSNSTSLIIKNTKEINDDYAKHLSLSKEAATHQLSKSGNGDKTLSESQFEELFQSEFKFTDGAAEPPSSRNIVESCKPNKSEKFRYKRVLSLQKKHSEEALSSNSVDLEEMFKEPFETPKEHSESLNVIAATEFSCEMPQKVVQNDSNSLHKTQIVEKTIYASENMSLNFVEGTEFSEIVQGNRSQVKPSNKEIKSPPEEAIYKLQVSNDNALANFMETSEEEVGRNSPTLFSPVPSDDEVTLVEITPIKKKESIATSDASFVLPPPLDESIAEFVDTEIPLPTSLLLPPKEFQSTETCNASDPLTSTQNNGFNFKEQQTMRNPNTMLEYSLLKMRTPNKDQPTRVSSSSLHRINPILSVMNDRHCPLTIVTPEKSTSPLPVVKTASVQKSILNYMKSHEDRNVSSKKIETASEPAEKPCIACTRLSKEKIIAINGLCSKKLASYSKDYSASVTHMVLMTTEDNRVKDHTIKYVSAVAAGVWVVSYSWIQECIVQGRIVAEEPYEVLDVTGLPGPKISRLNRLMNPLLKNYRIHCAPPFETTTLRDLEDVVRNLGGTVVHKPEDLKKENFKQVCLIITEARITQDFEQYEEWLERCGVISVDIEWLSRSVGQYSVISVRPYILCSEDNLETLGLPSELLTHIPDSQLTYTN